MLLVIFASGGIVSRHLLSAIRVAQLHRGASGVRWSGVAAYRYGSRYRRSGSSGWGPLVLVVIVVALMADAWEVLAVLAGACCVGVLAAGALMWTRRWHHRFQHQRSGRVLCAICQEPNFPDHGCHAFPVGRVSGHGAWRRSHRFGSWRKAQWRGVLIDNWGDAWTCDCTHASRETAASCARSHLRAHQGGHCHCFEHGRRVPTLVQASRARRVPIADLPVTAWQRMCDDAGHRCHYCGTFSRRLQKEHRIPLARGGSNSAANIVPACADCNLRKGVLTDTEFVAKMQEVARRAQTLPRAAPRARRPTSTSASSGRQRRR